MRRIKIVFHTNGTTPRPAAEVDVSDFRRSAHCIDVDRNAGRQIVGLVGTGAFTLVDGETIFTRCQMVHNGLGWIVSFMDADSRRETDDI